MNVGSGIIENTPTEINLLISVLIFVMVISILLNIKHYLERG
jgi:hypothetical protein